MRTSNDDVRDGFTVNGYDYDLQVWVIGGIVQRCGHPAPVECGCNAAKYAGQRIAEVRA